MNARGFITLCLIFIINATVYGTGAIAVLSIPALRDNMELALLTVIAASLVISPILAWVMAPRLRARFWYPRRNRPQRYETGPQTPSPRNN